MGSAWRIRESTPHGHLLSQESVFVALLGKLGTRFQEALTIVPRRLADGRFATRRNKYSRCG